MSRIKRNWVTIILLPCILCVIAITVINLISDEQEVSNVLPTSIPSPTTSTTLAPTSTPTSTPFPEPTSTSTVAPLSQEEQFIINIGNVLGESNRDAERVINILVLPDHIGVEWAINDSFSINDSAKIDVLNMLKTIQQSGLGYETISLDGTFPLIDQSGNTKEIYVIKTRYSDIDDIDFNLFLFENVYEIADYVEVHPAIE